MIIVSIIALITELLLCGISFTVFEKEPVILLGFLCLLLSLLTAIGSQNRYPKASTSLIAANVLSCAMLIYRCLNL